MKIPVSVENRKQNSKMKIAGLQKVTTIDYPGKIACTIFIYGCNFRCGFCHNPDLVIKKFGGGFSEDEILEFLKKRLNSEHYKASVTKEEYEETKKKYDKAKLVLRLLQSI